MTYVGVTLEKYKIVDHAESNKHKWKNSSKLKNSIHRPEKNIII